jgi:hypothetical protein
MNWPEADFEVGWVYVLSNPSFKGLKIGYTNSRVGNRIRELSTTGVPTPFVVEFQVLVLEPRAFERQLHEDLAAQRVSPDREFFECSLREVAEAIQNRVEEGDVWAITEIPSDFLQLNTDPPEKPIYEGDLSPANMYNYFRNYFDKFPGSYIESQALKEKLGVKSLPNTPSAVSQMSRDELLAVARYLRACGAPI